MTFSIAYDDLIFTRDDYMLGVRSPHGRTTPTTPTPTGQQGNPNVPPQTNPGAPHLGPLPHPPSPPPMNLNARYASDVWFE